MNGSNSDEVYVSNIIYSYADFGTEVYAVEDEEPVEQKSSLEVNFSEELVSDMNYLPYRQVVQKWFTRGLRYIYRTQLDFGGNFYSADTNGFISLFFHQLRVEDGCRRRKKLFLRAALRRLMKENISADELLYNLYIDRERFFDNSDGILDIECLKAKVMKALNTDIDEIEDLTLNIKRPSFVINPEVTNKRQAIGKARKEMTDCKIGNLYDCNLSFKQNMEALGVSKSRLYQFCKENGIDTKKAPKTGYNPELSIRENMKVMGCSKYQVEKAKKAFELNH